MPKQHPSKPIKILHTEWADGWGGQELRILNEMLGVRERKMQVAIACTSHSNISQYAKQHGIEVFHLPFSGNLDLKTLWGLIKIIRDHQFDIVNTHSGKDTWVGGLAAKLCGKKFIRTRHLGYRINPSLLNFINELADYIMTTGEHIRQSMIKYNRIKADKIASIPTGIDENIFDPKRFNKSEARKALGLKVRNPVIGTVANLRQAKRLDLFLQAAAQILQTHPKVQFVIGGQGPVQAKLKAQATALGIEQHITWPGFTDDPASFMAAFDIYMLTSDDEGVPQAVMQSLMMQLPTIATSAGSTRDLLHQDNFRLIDCGDVTAMVNNARELLDDKKLRTYYATRSRDWVVAHFSKSVMIDKVVAVYEKVMEKSG